MTATHQHHTHNFRPNYRPDIDGLRAIAILPVVAFHYFPRYAPGGFVGVDIFFVISGYLISQIIFRTLISGNFSFSEFYARRVQRIFPALIIVLIACYAFGWFALLPDEFKALGKHIAAGAGFVQNFVLYGEAGYFDVASELKPLLHLWSLALEEQFYLFFPLFVWLLWKARLNLFTGVALVALASFVMARKGVHTNISLTFFLTHTRMWELMAGALLAYSEIFHGWPSAFTRALCRVTFNRVIFHDVPNISRQPEILRNLTAGLGLTLIIVSITYFHEKTPWPSSRTLVPVLGTVMLIAAGPYSWINKRWLSAKPLVWIGLVSYPLYLWHWMLLSYVRVMEGSMPPREWRIALVFTSFMLAALTYWLVEKPIRYSALRIWKTAMLCILLTTVGLVGYNTYKRDGLAFRTKEINQIFDINEVIKIFKPALTICKKRFNFAEVELVEGDVSKFFCFQSKDAEPTILILGDSHGSPLFLGLDRELTGTNEVVVQLGGPGCLPFRETLSFDRDTTNEKDIHNCPKIINPALEFAKADNIKTVILVSRGPGYLSGKGFSLDQSTDEGHHNRVIIYRPRPDLSDHAAIWEEAMRATLAELTAAGKQVLFLLDNPELGFSPKKCIKRPVQLIAHGLTPCRVPKATFEKRNHEYRSLIRKILKDFPSVILIDAAKPFCDDKWCWAAKDGKIFYYDDDHLSLDGGRLVAREILPYLGLPGSVLTHVQKRPRVGASN